MGEKKTPQHLLKPVSDLQSGAVYGPIHSRRFGESLGINLLPSGYKFCDFDCVYCQYGKTATILTGEALKRAPELLSEIEDGLKQHVQLKTPVDCLTLAGNGEPTIHPDFSKIVPQILKLRRQYFPKARVGILSNSSQVARPEIRETLEMFDDRYMKLDAGTVFKHKEINRPKGNLNFDAMVEGLRKLHKVKIQSLFVQGNYNNLSQEDLDHWLEIVGFIQPAEVYVYTVDRGTAERGIEPVSKEKLNEIAQLCHAMTGVPTHLCD